MDITNQSEEIRFLFAQDGFVPVLKKMADAFVTMVEILSIPGEQFPHHRRNSCIAALKQQMNVIAHEDPRVNEAFPLRNVFSQPFQKQRSVLVVAKYGGFVDPTQHDMVQCAGRIEAGLAGRDESLYNSA